MCFCLQQALLKARGFTAAGAVESQQGRLSVCPALGFFLWAIAASSFSLLPHALPRREQPRYSQTPFMFLRGWSISVNQNIGRLFHEPLVAARAASGSQRNRDTGWLQAYLLWRTNGLMVRKGCRSRHHWLVLFHSFLWCSTCLFLGKRKESWRKGQRDAHSAACCAAVSPSW